MKLNKRLDESFLYTDLEKLRRIKTVTTTDCILMAVGFNIKENKFYSITG